VKVRVVIANADGALKPGMFAQVTLAGSQGEPRDGLFVPASAVQRDGDAWLVFVPVGDHEFQVREVETGRHHRGLDRGHPRPCRRRTGGHRRHLPAQV
jgi:multidrug efflux pump subunit AcrA (membrane-fusion protein)